MKTRVVCVSRTLAAGGNHIARAVSQKLGFRYADEEIIKEAAQREGVDVAVVEDAERRQSFFDRLLDSLAVAPSPEMMSFSPGFPVTPTELLEAGGPATTEHYRQLIREVVRDVAARGEVVIFAHASAVALGSSEGVLRVLVTASPQTRAERLAAAYDLSAKRAEKEIAESDKARRAYLRDFYDVTDEEPNLYDLVINTDVLTPREGVDIVLAATRPPKKGS